VLLAMFVVGGAFVYIWFRWQSVKNCKEYDYVVDSHRRSCYNTGAKREENAFSKKHV
jgi:hypothetical protein|tara:strand:+ start:373 stop:543 length:171 start_codon:yes stop_codon:yes gene_type:complete